MSFFILHKIESENQMKNFKKICIGTISLAVIFTSVSVFASEKDYQLTTSFTEDYIKWQNLSDEEKQEMIIPRISTIDMPKQVISEETVSNTKLREQVLNGNFEKSAKVALVGNNGYQLSKYNLNDERNVNVKVKHQGVTNECWAFSMTSVLETNLALTKNIQKTFSPRHMDYSLIRTFTDGIDEDNLDRTPKMGGLAQFAVAYLTNGRGAVLESQMPFENNSNLISLSDLNKSVDTVVTETVTFPELYKSYSQNGDIIYSNGGTGDSKIIYSDKEVEAFRNSIKNHIVNYGAISAVTAGNQERYYSNPNDITKSEAYFCNDESIERDHAITIIGWDDSYSRDNFTGAAKPKNNGAYICLNSYGTNNFKNGYLYISYEDVLIETYLYGIKSANSVDYDKIYQYNPTGENTSVGIKDLSVGYISEIFDRNSSQSENLQYVGVNIPRDMYLNIYVNPNGDNPSLDACKLVKSTNKLSAGYHRIAIDPINLTGNKFTVVIEEISDENRFEFSIEIAFRNSLYSTILGNPGKSLYSIDGYRWAALSSETVPGFDMRTADMTIKAFTKNGYIEEPENPQQPEQPEEPDNPVDTKKKITSTVYTIKNSDIYKVAYNTTAANFKNNISTDSDSIKIYDNKNNEIKDNELVKTGAKVNLSDGTVYTIIVRGDASCDGKITLVDLSKIIAHYGDENKYGLTGDPLKSADLNFDGKITLTDVSQIVSILGNSLD